MTRGYIYVAGKMRSMPEFNFPAFSTATELLRADGWTVFSPAERDLAEGFDPTGMTGNEDLAELGFSLRDALAADMKYICEEADHIYMLDGWENSSGARAEKAVAEVLGHTVLYQDVDREARTPAEVAAYSRGYDEGYDDGMFR